MNILHICSIDNTKTNGINNVVPYHFIYQSKYATAALVNCNNIKIEQLESYQNCYDYNLVKDNLLDIPCFNKKIDIVIFHGIYFLEYIKIAKYLRNNKIPYIIIPHGSLTKDAQKIKPIKKKFGNLLFRNFINNSIAIQYLSNTEVEMSSSFKHNYIISGNGMVKPDKKKENFSDKGLSLIYVGRYAIYHKGIDRIIDACVLIKEFMLENNISINLYGAKDDGEKAINQLVVNKDVKELIRVRGPIFDEEKINTILKHDVFIQTSRLEGQPLGVMEAIYLGMPVIVSNGTTFGEIVLDNYCGYVGDTPEEIADAIRLCFINKEKLMDFSHNSFKYANDNFLWDNIAKKAISLYKEYL